MQVNVHEAKSQLSQLLLSVERGEEVVIARNGVPVAKLVPAKKRGGMILGLLEKEGKGVVTPDDETLAAMDREIEKMFYENIEIDPFSPPRSFAVQEKRTAYKVGKPAQKTKSPAVRTPKR